MPANLPRNLYNYPIRIGTLVGFDDTPVEYWQEQLFGDGHTAIYGGTGKGKSKMGERMLRQVFGLFDAPGGIVIDPHGDLVDSLMLYMKQAPENVHRRILENLHYVTLQGQYRFSLDPFHPIYARGVEDHQAWIESQAHRVGLAILRQKGEYSFKGMPQLERFMKTLLMAAGTWLDDEGTHLPLSDIDILYTPNHPCYEQVMQRIVPRLDRRTQRNLEEILQARVTGANDPIASTKNRLETFFGVQTRAIFSGEAPTIDIPSIVDNQGWLLVNLGIPKEADGGVANAIGSLLLRMYINEVTTRTQIKDRRSSIVWIDEASRYIGEDLVETLRESRKYKLSCCLCVQDLDGLDNEEVTMSSKVTSLCDHQFTFQQKNEEDMKRLAGVMAIPNLQFEKLYHYGNLQLGHEVVELLDKQVGVSHTDGVSQSEGITTIDGHSVTESETLRQQQATTTTDETSASDAVSDSTSQERSIGRAESEEHVSGYDVATGQETGSGLARKQSRSLQSGSAERSTSSSTTGTDTSLTHTQKQGLDQTTETSRGMKDGSRLGSVTTNTLKTGSGESFRTSESNTTGESYETSNSERSSFSKVSEVNVARSKGPQGATKVTTSMNKSTGGGESATVEKFGRKAERTTTQGKEQKEYVETSRADAESAEQYWEWTTGEKESETVRTGTEDSQSVTDRRSRTSGSERETSQGETNSVGEEQSTFDKESTSLIEKHGVNRRVGTSVADKTGTSHQLTKTTGSRHSDAVERSEGRERALQYARQQQHLLAAGTEKSEAVSRSLAAVTKQTLMAVNPVITQSTGSLEDAIKDQIFRFFKLMRMLSRAQVMHNYDNAATSIINVDFVGDVRPFATPEERQAAIDVVREAILTRHAYNYIPDTSIEREDARIDGWLQRTLPAVRRGRLASPVVEQATIEPEPVEPDPPEQSTLDDAEEGFDI